MRILAVLTIFLVMFDRTAFAADCLVITDAKPMQRLIVDDVRIYVPVDGASGAPVRRKCPTAAEMVANPVKPVDLAAALYGTGKKKPPTVRGPGVVTSVAPPTYADPQKLKP